MNRHESFREFNPPRPVDEPGIDVRDEVLVVGVDDIPAAAYLSVQLTTVHVPNRKMGEHAAALLFDQIESRADDPMKHVRLDVALVTCGSTRPLPC